jgi:hypothetical protein
MSNGMTENNSKIVWKEHAFSMATLYSILTAMVGVLLTVIITDKEIVVNWYWPIGLLSLSFICLILGIEKLSDVLDEDDIDKYLAWFLSYNTGVISMFFGMATFIFLHFHLHFSVHFSNGNVCINGSWNLIPFLVALLASWKWIYDNWYLLFKNKKDYDKYREELLGHIEPEKDRDWLMKIHQSIRRLFHK